VVIGLRHSPVIESTAHTTRLEDQPLLNDASWVRQEIAVIRQSLDALIKRITWDDCLGDCCQELMRSQLHLLSARDASHRWEGVEHPLHRPVNTEIID
jgi:hypothetical protein